MLGLSRRVFQTQSKEILSAASFIARRCRSTDQPSESQSEEGVWLHKISEAQEMFLYAHRSGVRYTTPVYRLNSRKPLSPDVVRQTMIHLERKSPVYHIMIRERDEELWCYKLNDIHADIDFKVYEKGTLLHEIQTEMGRSFDEVNGPLWRVGLVPAAEDDDCPFPEIKKNFPYQYYLLKCFHHSIFDGMTAVSEVHQMFDIMNATIEGETTDLRFKGEYVSDKEYQELFSNCKERLLKNPERLHKLREEILKSDKPPILLKAFKRPDVEVPESRYITIKVEPAVLNGFFSNCKQRGITYGNALQTVVNSALIELVKDAGADDDSFDISVFYSTDLRRYMRKRDYPILGLHVRTMTSLITMSKNVRDQFWDSCRNVQEINKCLVRDVSPIEQDVVRALYSPQKPAKDFFASPKVTYDFGLNNVGFIPMYGSGNHVKLTGIGNFTSAHRFVYPFYSQVITYGGDMNFMITYATDWLTDETANELINKIKSLIEYASQT